MVTDFPDLVIQAFLITLRSKEQSRNLEGGFHAPSSVSNVGFTSFSLQIGQARHPVLELSWRLCLILGFLYGSEGRIAQ